MELIFALAKLAQYVVIAPIWWVADHAASIFYPMEGEKNHDNLVMLFAFLLSAGLVAAVVLSLASD